MKLRAPYLLLAHQLQEAGDAGRVSADDVRQWLASIRGKVSEAGARNNRSDQAIIQTIHDHSMALGAMCAEPDADDMAESAAVTQEGAGGQSTDLQLRESADSEAIQIQEAAKTDYEIKLIAPGKGAMAYYPADVLKRDGPIAFPAETKVYLNHQTRSKEAEEGGGNRDVSRLVGVLTKAAEWKESHARGAGLYSRVKVFSDYAQTMDEKHPYLAMSINANGRQAMEAGKLATKEGLPLLSALTPSKHTSVDVVPIAGAGGMILTEAAKPGTPTQEADEMTAEEAKKLVEAAVSAATAPLRERALKGDAREEATRLLESVTLPAAAKTRIIERSIGTLPLTAEGALDVAKLREAVVAESKAEGEYIAAITGGSGPRGMGIAAPPAPKPEDIAAKEAQAKRDEADEISIYESLGMSKTAAAHAAKGRAA